ncbi:MAG: MmgE/PrpD family protein [Deinococcales bacterium]
MSSIMDPLVELCEWASSVSFEELDADVRQAARDVLLDDLGAILGGSAEPRMAALREDRLRCAGPGSSAVFGVPLQYADPLSAAEVHGMAGCWLELDEGYRVRGCHAGLYTVPAAFALAQDRDLSGAEALLALVTAYEVVTRVARAWRLPRQVAHVHGVFSPIGAAAAASKIMGFDAKTFTEAVRAAAAVALVAPYRQAMEGALVRNVWAGAGARLGIQAAWNALRGVAGSEATLEEAFERALGAEPRPEELTHSLGSEYAVTYGYHKPFACCRHLHAAVGAALSLREDEQSRWKSDELKYPSRIVVETHADAAGLDARQPHNPLSAKFSLPHAVAVALATGSAGIEAFKEEAIHQPAVGALRDRVHIRVLDDIGGYPDDRATRVTVEWPDGTSSSSHCLRPPGDPSVPLSREELDGKFEGLASRTLPVEAVEGLRSFVENLEGQTSMRDWLGPGVQPTAP